MDSRVIEFNAATGFDYIVQGTALLGLLGIILRVIILVVAIIVIVKGIKALNLYIRLKELQIAEEENKESDHNA